MNPAHDKSDAPRTKVLHIFNRMDSGGAELRTLDVLRHVDRRQFQVDFCTLSDRAGYLDEEILNLGGRIHPTPPGVHFPRRFVYLLRRESYDVVHAHTLYASGLFLRLARFAGVPIRIAHFRSSGDGKCSTWPRRVKQVWLRRWIDRHATRILAVSRSAMELAWRRDWNADPRCQVVYNGLDTSRWPAPRERSDVRREFGFPADCPLVIHVGNLLPDKNHRRVISIFAEMLKRRSDARLLLVGQGQNEIETQLCRQIDSSDLAARVTFGGRRIDVPQLLHAADVMLFPSLREGLPGAVLEACATGLPVVANRLPAICEIQPFLPSLRSLSIDAPDEVWCTQAWDACAHGYDTHMREAAQQAFAASPFQIEQATRSLCQIWSHPAAHRFPTTGAA